MFWRFVNVVVSALTHRFLRGGGIPLGSTLAARVCWGLAGFFSAWSATSVPLWVSAATGLLAAASMVDCGGHGEHQDLGRMGLGYTKDGKAYELLTWVFLPLIRRSAYWPFWARELLDGFCMCWIGAWRGAATVPVIAFWDTGYAVAYVAGFATQGLCYWVGYRVPWTFKGLAARSPEWGELMTAGAVGVAVLFR